LTPRPIDRRGLALLSAGHACSDMTQGALPALLPFLIAERGFSYSQAGALVLAASIGSSVVQPLFGLFADRLSSSWLVPAGVATSGAGIALVGVVGSFPLTLLVLVAGGLGVAAFHPEAARLVNYVSGDRRGAGMSYFAVGGNAGFALGPALVVPVVLAFGLPGTLLLALPTTVVALLLTRLRPSLGARLPAPGRRAGPAPEWRPFTRLVGAAVLRTGAFFGLQAFMPLYLVVHLGASKGQAAAALTVMLVAGAAGTLIGGRLADRIGRRNLLIGSMALLLPIVLALPMASLPFAFALLVGVGLTLDAPFSTTVVFGQELLRGREGLASGITYGLAVGLGGLIASALGVLADTTSLTTTLYVIALLPVPALLLALTLPGAAREPVPV